MSFLFLDDRGHALIYRRGVNGGGHILGIQQFQNYDVIIIGGGVNGCAIARDAVGRGLRVLVCEKDDLGSSFVKNIAWFGLSKGQSPPTTNRSTQKEDAILRRVIPHLSKSPDADSSILAKLTKFITKRPESVESPLRTGMIDHRFVLLNARDAADRGAVIRTKTRVLSGVRESNTWAVTLQHGEAVEQVSCSLIVDTANVINSDPASNVLTCGQVSVALVNSPNNPVQKVHPTTSEQRFFSIEIEDGLHLIGFKSTNSDQLSAEWLQDCLRQNYAQFIGVAAEEIEFRWFGTASTCPQQTPDNSAYPDSGNEMEFETRNGDLPLFSVRGGSVFTARRMAEDVVAEMAPYVSMIGKKWTPTAPLPGGDFQYAIRGSLIQQLIEKYSFLSETNLLRLFDDYGTETSRVLQGVKNKSDLGEDFGSGLFETEVRWLVEKEWATSAEDILWRRTRLGLKMPADQVRRLENWLSQFSTNAQPAV